MSLAEETPSTVLPIPSALTSHNPLRWISIFGPGAIIASLTIGTGELIFSSRGGAIFGYRILFLFVVISVLKWSLVYSTSRQMVLSGRHPFQRWMDLPGPRGWFPLVLFFLAAAFIPVWVSFHSGVLGNFVASMTGTKGQLNGAVDQLWGAAILLGVVVLAVTGGYASLERVQLAIVVTMVSCVGICLLLYNPSWWDMLLGAMVPQRLEYPSWLYSKYPETAATPVWIETTLYVGVIGGAGYDYLAYTSFLRDKKWGLAGSDEAAENRLDLDSQLAQIAEDKNHCVRHWLRAPLVDCTLSFVVVLIFSAVFVASGHLILGPAEQIPDDKNFLDHQARFITDLNSRLLPLYYLGAFLTMLGTLYGTIEVAPTVLREFARAVDQKFAAHFARQLRIGAVVWCAAGAFGVLVWSFFLSMQGGDSKPPGLIAIVTPANLFTGVLCCGFICLLNPWIDHRFFPRQLRMPRILLLLNILAGVIFLALGLKGYWDWGLKIDLGFAFWGLKFDLGGWFAFLVLLATIALGWLGAAALNLWQRNKTAKNR